jgi:uncharacterized membrane protein
MPENSMAHDKSSFGRQDQVEIIVGACIMGFPAATTAEIWELGESLSLGRVIMFAVSSFVVLALTIHVLHGHGSAASNRYHYVVRVLNTYGLTVVVCAFMLLGLGQLDFFDEPLTGLKRIIIVAFPASFAATAVDSFADNTGNH